MLKQDIRYQSEPWKFASFEKSSHFETNNNKKILSLGETDLCQSLDNQKGCSNDEDVLCKLMHKVRHYLRTRYNVTDETEDGLRGPFRPRRKLLRPTPTRAMPKVIVFLG